MRIAISQRLIENTTYPETRDALDVQWGRWFAEAGWLPMPLTTGFGPVGRLLDGLSPDAVLLTGGNDLGQFADNPLSKMRDAFETEVLDWALDKRVPVVGICRGAQFLAQRFGSELARVEGHVATRHECRVVQDHRLAGHLEGVCEVNSFHQIGIVSVAESLSPLAFAGDGTLEAFTHHQNPCLGIMWHPERETPFQNGDLALMDGFLKDAISPAR